MQCLKKHAPQKKWFVRTHKERQETKKNGGGSKTARPGEDDKKRRPIPVAGLAVVYKLTDLCQVSLSCAGAPKTRMAMGEEEAGGATYVQFPTATTIHQEWPDGRRLAGRETEKNRLMLVRRTEQSRAGSMPVAGGFSSGARADPVAVAVAVARRDTCSGSGSVCRLGSDAGWAASGCVAAVDR